MKHYSGVRKIEKSVMLKIFIFASLHAFVHGEQVADVVLSCSFIEEGGGMTGDHFVRSPATMVLKNLPMSSDISSETITPYIPPNTPNPDDLIFEATTLSVEIPEVESILHADCNEQEVICELSRYIPQGTKLESLPAHFIASIQLEGGGLGYTLVLQTIASENAESNIASLMQSKLQLPLSQWGTLITDVVFVLFSRSPSIAAPIGEDTLLDCGYRQQDMPTNQNLGLEWRWQYRGQGKTILEIKESAAGISRAEDRASANSVLLVRDGNASLTMKKLRVSDQGTYICTINSGLFQTQQIIQLNIMQPPKVFFEENIMTFRDESPKRLSCHCERYYPLDVKVEWFFQLPSETENISLTDESSVSSHQQHSDETFSLSSFLIVRPTKIPSGTVFTCRVSHIALQTPIDVGLTVLKPEPGQFTSLGEYYWMILVTLVLSILFLYQASR